MVRFSIVFLGSSFLNDNYDYAKGMSETTGNEKTPLLLKSTKYFTKMIFAFKANIRHFNLHVSYKISLPVFGLQRILFQIFLYLSFNPLLG